MKEVNGSSPTSNLIISVRDQPDYLERAVNYFSSKWKIEPELYRKSISDGISTAAPLPRWYLLLYNDEIIGSYGLIENDFMVRKDFTPWLCALYVEDDQRGQELGASLLKHGRSEAGRLGFSNVYLCTDHIGFYEKYGWEFLGLEESEWGGMTRVYVSKSL